jgi:hypothetical protein
MKNAIFSPKIGKKSPKIGIITWTPELIISMCRLRDIRYQDVQKIARQFGTND